MCLPIAAPFQAAQRVLSIPSGTVSSGFLSSRGEGSSLRVLSASMGSLVFCWLQPAFSLLRISSSLAVGWENTVVAVCGTGRLSSAPQPFALRFIAHCFLSSAFFPCSLAWFPAIFPMPGRHSMIFHTGWRGRRQAGSREPLSLTRGWRWQALASTMVLASPGCQQELCSACRLWGS